MISSWSSVRPRQEMFAMAGLAREAFAIPRPRFLMGVAPKLQPADEIRLIDVNGFSGIGVYRAGRRTG